MNQLLAIYRKDRHISRLVIMIVAWMIFMAITRFSKFYTVINFTTMASQFPEFGIMALGGMLCMITGGIDRSSVGVANVTSITMGMFMKTQMVEGSISAFTMIAAFAMAICIGLVVGAINGVLISKIKIPPILTTLGMNQLVTGISMVITGGNAVSDLPMNYAETINQKLIKVIPGKRGVMQGVLSVQLIFFVVIALIIWFLLARTSFGKKIYMIGTNENVARFSGVKVDRMMGYGGLYKTPVVGQKLTAACFNAPVSVMKTAGEGGAWGIALLAEYMVRRADGETLEDYLDQKVFADMESSTIAPDPADVAGFNKFMEGYSACLSVERAAVDTLK